MNLFFSNICQCVKKIWSPQLQSVRFRYHAEKMEKGKLLRRFGYKESITTQGLLPRMGDDRRIVPIPIYRPKDSWAEKRALFGQNDYIDILGNEKLHPTRIMYKVPSWLRGVKGNEFQILIRKRKFWSKGVFPVARPTKWREINKRISYLYRHMNRKTDQYHIRDE